MPSELRYGVLGCGKISQDFVQSLRNCKQKNTVVAAAARDLSRAQEFVKEYAPDAKAYDDYNAVLKDENVDIVYIGLLNDRHLEWILASLDANKHVLSEKPMVTNIEQIQQVQQKAQEKKLFVMEAFWSRFFPAWLKLREIIESKEMGELKVVGMNFGEYVAENRFHLDKDQSPLFDIGYYVVGLAMYAYNDEKPEKTDIVGQKNEDGVDLWGNITLQFKGGRHACLYYNGTMRASTAAFFAFEKGMVEIPEFFWCPDHLIRINGKLPDAKRERLNFSLGDYEDYELISHGSGLRYEADHVFEQIEKGNIQSPIMPLENTKQIVEVLEGLRHKIGVVYKSD